VWFSRRSCHAEKMPGEHPRPAIFPGIACERQSVSLVDLVPASFQTGASLKTQHFSIFYSPRRNMMEQQAFVQNGLCNCLPRHLPEPDASHLLTTTSRSQDPSGHVQIEPHTKLFGLTHHFGLVTRHSVRPVISPIKFPLLFFPSLS
jgi:hypothetical protein